MKPLVTLTGDGTFRVPSAEEVLRLDLPDDPHLAALHEELLSYGPPGDYPPPGAHDIALPIRIRHRGHVLSFINTVATFGTAVDITLEQIAIESYFPADRATAQALGARS